MKRAIAAEDTAENAAPFSLRYDALLYSHFSLSGVKRQRRM
jgi:hypothetical protein